MANMTITKQNHVNIIRDMQVWIYTQEQKIVFTTKPNLRQNKKTKLHQTDLNKREILPGANIAAQKRKKQTLFQTHHIIPQHMWKDNKIKKLLQNLGLTKNSRENTVVLPVKRGSIQSATKENTQQKFRNAINRIQHATPHRGNHCQEYYDTIRNILSYISELPLNLQADKLHSFLSFIKRKMKKGEISLRRANKHQPQNDPKTQETKQEDCNNISDINIDELEDIDNSRILQSVLETSELEEDSNDISDIYIKEQLKNIYVNTNELT